MHKLAMRADDTLALTRCRDAALNMPYLSAYVTPISSAARFLTFTAVTRRRALARPKAFESKMLASAERAAR